MAGALHPVRGVSSIDVLDLLPWAGILLAGLGGLLILLGYFSWNIRKDGNNTKVRSPMALLGILLLILGLGALAGTAALAA